MQHLNRSSNSLGNYDMGSDRSISDRGNDSVNDRVKITKERSHEKVPKFHGNSKNIMILCETIGHQIE